MKGIENTFKNELIKEVKETAFKYLDFDEVLKKAKDPSINFVDYLQKKSKIICLDLLKNPFFSNLKSKEYGKVAKDIIFVFLNALVLAHKNLNYKQEALKWTKN